MSEKLFAIGHWKSQSLAILNVGNEPLSRLEAVSLYVALPGVLAFVLGWHQIPLGDGLPRPGAIAFAAVLVFGLWTATAICTGLVYALLRRISPPLWATTTLGVVVAALVALPGARVYLIWGYEWAGVAPAIESLGEIGFNLKYFRKLFAHVVPGGVCWVLANYFYRNVLYVRRYGTEPRGTVIQSAPSIIPSEQAGAANPAFISMLPVQQRGALIALKAEDHYLQVYTENGGGLVRWRFADAMNAVAALNGFQVHRSYWVNAAFIRALHRQGHVLELEMNNGLRVPVSRAYAKDVKARLGAEV